MYTSDRFAIQFKGRLIQTDERQVKPNVGHSEGAAGITSIIKGVLALERKIIPPNTNFACPNPKSKLNYAPRSASKKLTLLVPFEEGKLQVPIEPTSWPHTRQERISINSFGLGGSNAHVRDQYLQVLGRKSDNDRLSLIPLRLWG